MRSPTAELQACTRPVNRLAAQGLATDSVQRTFAECPTLYPGNFRDLQKRMGKFWEDITGWTTINGMKVIGLVSIDNNYEHSRWAVRCSCGRYEIRGGGGIRAKCRRGKPDFCDYCFRDWLHTHGPGSTFAATFPQHNVVIQGPPAGGPAGMTGCASQR